MGSLYEIILDYLITSFVKDDGNFPIYGRYNSTDTFRFVHWYQNSPKSVWNDFTENNYWKYFYEVRHYPYPNIPTNDKINVFSELYWDDYGTDRIWADH